MVSVLRLCNGRQQIGIKLLQKLHSTDYPINSDGQTHTHKHSVSLSIKGIVYQRDKGLWVTRANHHLSFLHTSSVHLYTHFNLSLCETQIKVPDEVCVCVYVRLLFSSCSISFCTLFFRSPDLQLCFTLICCVLFSPYLIYFSDPSMERWASRPISIYFLNTSWLWPSFYLLLFYFRILYHTFSQVSDKHNIQPFFLSQCGLITCFTSPFHVWLSGYLVFVGESVLVCIYLFQAALIFSFSSQMKIRFKHLTKVDKTIKPCQTCCVTVRASAH